MQNGEKLLKLWSSVLQMVSRRSRYKSHIIYALEKIPGMKALENKPRNKYEHILWLLGKVLTLAEESAENEKNVTDALQGIMDHKWYRKENTFFLLLKGELPEEEYDIEIVVMPSSKDGTLTIKELCSDIARSDLYSLNNGLIDILESVLTYKDFEDMGLDEIICVRREGIFRHHIKPVKLFDRHQTVSHSMSSDPKPDQKLPANPRIGFAFIHLSWANT